MTTPTTDPSAAIEQSAQHIRELTEQFIDVAKQGGNASLDAFEKALQSMIDFQQRAAGASQVEWVSTVAQAHAKFVQDVSAAYVSAAREMLK
jgi:predicted RNA-binding Zn ribbon-like protein